MWKVKDTSKEKGFSGSPYHCPVDWDTPDTPALRRRVVPSGLWGSGALPSTLGNTEGTVSRVGSRIEKALKKSQAVVQGVLVLESCSLQNYAIGDICDGQRNS